MKFSPWKNEKRILIIDDDLDLLMLLERRLQKEGFEIETAASLSEAETILPYFKPQLVLLDINVQGEDGRQLCWKIKKQQTNTNTKVIVMSGYDYHAGISILFGADDFLMKPLNTDYLLFKLNEVFSSFRQKVTGKIALHDLQQKNTPVGVSKNVLQ